MFSDVIEKFVIYGRTAKPVMLFVALAAGSTAATLVANHRRAGLMIVGVALILFVPNLLTVLRIVFPSDFLIQANDLASTTLRQNPGSTLRLINAGFFHRPPQPLTLPAHKVLLSRPHPVEYRPYQYEGYDRAMRRDFAAQDISMRLVRLNEAPAWLDQTPRTSADYQPFAGVLEIELELPANRPVGTSEPLLVSGKAERGDFISLRYLPNEQLRIELDHWNWGLVVSEPFTIHTVPGQIHRLVISAGSLLPPALHPFMRAHPQLAPLSNRLVVDWNGQLVCLLDAPFYPASKSDVVIGSNYLGGSTTVSAFTGRIVAARTLDPRSAARVQWGLDLPKHDATNWGGQPGPLAATFSWQSATNPLSGAATLFSAARGESTLHILIQPKPEGFVFELRVNGQTQAISSPVALPGDRHELELWAPLLMPSVNDVAPSERALAQWAVTHLILRVDGHSVFTKNGVALELTSSSLTATHSAEDVAYAWGETWPLRLSGAANRVAPFPGRWLRVGPPAEARPLPLTLQLTQLNLGAEHTRFAPLVLRLRLPDVPAGTAQPLVSSGHTGIGDIIYVVRETDGRVRFGHDHWGWQPALSPPVDCPPNQDCTVTISFGSLHSGETDPLTRATAGRQGRPGPMRVLLNGREVFAAERECYASDPSEIMVGLNLIGASSCARMFTGEILSTHIADRTP